MSRVISSSPNTGCCFRPQLLFQYQWASRSQLRFTWAGQWAGLTPWQELSPVSRLLPLRRWPRPRRPPPPPAPRAPPLPPRDLRPRSTARTVANLYVPGRTTASTCSSTPVRHASFSSICLSFIYLVLLNFNWTLKDLNQMSCDV